MLSFRRVNFPLRLFGNILLYMSPPNFVVFHIFEELFCLKYFNCFRFKVDEQESVINHLRKNSTNNIDTNKIPLFLGPIFNSIACGIELKINQQN